MARRGDGIYLRGRTWWLDFRHQRKRHVVRLGKGINRTVAGEIARVKRAAILKGEAGIGGPKRTDLTLDKASEIFLTWTEANKRRRTARTYRQCIERLEAAFPGRRLSELSPFDLERYKRTRIEAGVKVMVNRELACLRALYNRCREWGKYDGDNPAARVKPLRESPGWLRFLEPAEEADLLGASGEPLRTMVLVGVHAGLRLLSEALTFRWADVDLKRSLLTVQAAYAKSGKTRSVPLNRPLRAARAEIPTARSAPRSRRPAGRPGSRTSRPTSSGTPSPHASQWRAWTRGRSRSWAAGRPSRWWSATRISRRPTRSRPSSGSLRVPKRYSQHRMTAFGACLVN